MKSSKHIVIAVAVVLLLTVAGAGIYRRVTAAKAADDPAGSSAARSDLPDVASASSRFDADAPVPVEGAEVLQGEMVMNVSANGEAASRRSTIVRAQVGGQIQSIRVRENSAVGAAQVLVTIDPTEFELSLAEAQAGYRQAMASFREMTLGDDQNIKDEAIRRERREAARDRAQVESREVAVKRAELNLERTSVKAPFGGRVANLKVVPGQFVTAGEELLTVQEMDPIRVEVQVLEGQITDIAPGRRAQVSFTAFPGTTFNGTVETINPIVSESRHARVTVAVPNPQGRILPGMSARVTLGGERLDDRIMVPKAAVLERDQGRTLVFIFKPDSAGSDVGRAEWRYVTRGRENDDYYELVPGEYEPLKPGEIVLTAGHYSLSHDKVVRLVEKAPRDGGRS